MALSTFMVHVPRSPYIFIDWLFLEWKNGFTCIGICKYVLSFYQHYFYFLTRLFCIQLYISNQTYIFLYHHHFICISITAAKVQIESVCIIRNKECVVQLKTNII
jgi:hypothetical protein